MSARALLAASVLVLSTAVFGGMYWFVSSYKPTEFVSDKKSFLDAKRQIKCLADNIYFEANNQSFKGMIGVAYVTINRSLSGQWPEDLCSVVYQKTTTVCQFSWVCEHKKKIDDVLWQKCYDVANYVWYKYNPEQDPTLGATYYHATYVNPKWKLQKTIQIGDHIFYK